uniref:Uncharacterized protein n=1 Tax=Caenorhabditis japonica TaxID=281687 RepID=A0A8R1EW80_CAEJA
MKGKTMHTPRLPEECTNDIILEEQLALLKTVGCEELEIESGRRFFLVAQNQETEIFERQFMQQGEHEKGWKSLGYAEYLNPEQNSIACVPYNCVRRGAHLVLISSDRYLEQTNGAALFYSHCLLFCL